MQSILATILFRPYVTEDVWQSPGGQSMEVTGRRPLLFFAKGLGSPWIGR